MNLLLLAGLGALAAGFVLRPIFSERLGGSETEPEARRDIERLAEQKERILATLKDLEFEHEAGKLSDEDYQRVRTEDLAQVARIMKRMDELASKGPSKPKAPPATPASPAASAVPPGTAPAEESSCTACGQANPSAAKFCLRCGKPLQIPLQCPACGTELPEQARFCTHCGAKVKT